MTSHWGPLGWITLHSASMLYSENPEASEKALMKKFLDSFGETISCYHCKSHFLNMLSKYITAIPSYLDSKKDFMLFVFRAHNTVNKRLDKPILQTVQDCITTLKNANAYSSFETVRNSYLTYLQNNWNKELTAHGFSLRKKVQDLIKINNEYLNLRTIDWDYTFSDSVILIIEEKTQMFQRIRKVGGFKNGRLQF
jgi:hypothetical protein